MDIIYWLQSYLYGFGISTIVALFFAVHVLKTGRHWAWLLFLFFFPWLGCLVYFFAEFLPNPSFASRGSVGRGGLSRSAFSYLNPKQQLKKAQAEYEVAPSVVNALGYAKALSAMNQSDEAVRIFDANLTGMWQTDVDYLESMCYALIDADQGERALAVAKKIRKLNADHKPPTVALLHALSYGLLGHEAEAQTEFEVATRGSDMLALSQYAIWAASTGKKQLANSLRARMEESWKVWSPQHRRMHKDTFKQVDKAIAAMAKAVT